MRILVLLHEKVSAFSFFGLSLYGGVGRSYVNEMEGFVAWNARLAGTWSLWASIWPHLHLSILGA